jgi:hypothetical protein
MPPAADGNAFLAAFVTNALRGAFPPLDLIAICLVQAMVAFCYNDDGWKCCVFTCFSMSHGGFFFVLPVRHARAKNFRSSFTHHYFCIFNIHHE